MGNKFYGEGNLGTNPELRRKTGSNEDNDAVCNMRIYFDKPVPQEGGGFEDKGGFWMNVELWGKRGIRSNELLLKGTRVVVEGSIIGKNWKDGITGEDRVTLVVRAKRVNPDLMVVESFKQNSNHG